MNLTNCCYQLTIYINIKHKKNRPVPVITIPSENSHLEIKKIQQREKINIKLSREHNNILKIYPATPVDHRMFTKILDKFNQEYYCTNIDAEKILKKGFKGLPKIY